MEEGASVDLITVATIRRAWGISMWWRIMTEHLIRIHPCRAMTECVTTTNKKGVRITTNQIISTYLADYINRNGAIYKRVCKIFYLKLCFFF